VMDPLVPRSRLIKSLIAAFIVHGRAHDGVNESFLEAANDYRGIDQAPWK
jgi:hypothetical protein